MCRLDISCELRVLDSPLQLRHHLQPLRLQIPEVVFIVGLHLDALTVRHTSGISGGTELLVQIFLSQHGGDIGLSRQLFGVPVRLLDLGVVVVHRLLYCRLDPLLGGSAVLVIPGLGKEILKGEHPAVQTRCVHAGAFHPGSLHPGPFHTCPALDHATLNRSAQSRGRIAPWHIGSVSCGRLPLSVGVQLGIENRVDAQGLQRRDQGFRCHIRFIQLQNSILIVFAAYAGTVNGKVMEPIVVIQGKSVPVVIRHGVDLRVGITGCPLSLFRPDAIDQEGDSVAVKCHIVHLPITAPPLGGFIGVFGLGGVVIGPCHQIQILLVALQERVICLLQRSGLAVSLLDHLVCLCLGRTTPGGASVRQFVASPLQCLIGRVQVASAGRIQGLRKVVGIAAPSLSQIEILVAHHLPCVEPGKGLIPGLLPAVRGAVLGKKALVNALVAGSPVVSSLCVNLLLSAGQCAHHPAPVSFGSGVNGLLVIIHIGIGRIRRQRAGAVRLAGCPGSPSGSAATSHNIAGSLIRISTAVLRIDLVLPLLLKPIDLALACSGGLGLFDRQRVVLIGVIVAGFRCHVCFSLLYASPASLASRYNTSISCRRVTGSSRCICPSA